MLKPETILFNDLVRRWEEGDEGAADELLALCLPLLSQEAGEEASREWLLELRAYGAKSIGFDSSSHRNFLDWAVMRVKLFAEDAHRKLVYAFYSGDESALDELYRLTRSDLVAALSRFRSLLPDGATQDIVADFFTDLLKDARDDQRRYIAARGPFLAWARAVVNNSALSFLRKSGRLNPIPEDWEHLSHAEFIVEDDHDEQSFRRWIEAGLTSEQRKVLALLVMGWEQEEIAADCGFGPAKVSKMLDEIRAKIADRMQSGSYHEELEFALDRIRSSKAVKGLLTRLFLRFVAPTLLDILRKDQTWARAAVDAFGDDHRSVLWQVNPENKDAVRNVANRIVGFYCRIAAAEPGHAFCALTRKMSEEPWGKQIAMALEVNTTQMSAGMTNSPGEIKKGGGLT